MTTIYERVNAALATISPPVPFGLAPYKTIAGDLPDTFLAYQVIDDGPKQHADDDETMRGYLVQVNIFDRIGLVNLPDVDSAMRTAGFVKSNRRQLPYDSETRHFGLAKSYLYQEGV
jgi:hypothetical protein